MKKKYLLLFLILFISLFALGLITVQTPFGVIVLSITIPLFIVIAVVNVCCWLCQKRRNGAAEDTTDLESGMPRKFCCWSSQKRRNRAAEDTTDLESGMPRKFSAKELKKATKNFRKKLGEGAFGAVFEGRLESGTRVAVKRLDQSSGQGQKEFQAEVKTIGSVHHFSLVRLVGFCSKKHHKLLVYAYMSNGSLDKWIFSRNDDLTFDWPTRRKIILHIAKGLSYLHEGCSPRIIHLDLKPQNVLLDDHFNAKLSDFGLARLIDRDQSQVHTTIRGTRGYMAPEWFTSLAISEKVDVYSFGIVVLEMLCGRKIIDLLQLREEDVSLLQLVRRKAEAGQLSDVVDKRNPNMLRNKQAAVKIIKLAILCLRDDSRQRPSMSTVVKVVEDGLEIEEIVDYSFLTLSTESYENVNSSG